ncbi:MAG: TolC family protein [Chthoniobacterales bacterium]
MPFRFNRTGVLFLCFAAAGSLTLLAQTPTPTPAPSVSATPAASPSPTLSDIPAPAANFASFAEIMASPSPSASPGSTPLATPVPSGTNSLSDIPIPAGNVTPMPSIAPLPTASPAAAPGSGAADETIALPFAAPTTQDTVALPAPEQSENQQNKAFQITPRSLDTFLDPKLPNMTLNDSIAFALKNNVDILNSIQQIRNTSGQFIQVFSQAMPNVQITTSYVTQAQQLANPSGSNNNGPATLNLGNGIVLTIPQQSNFVQDTAWNIQIKGTQMIFNGAVLAGIRAAKYSEDLTFYSLRQVIDTVIANVKISFYQVVLNRALIVAQEQSVDLLAQQLKDQQNRYDAGTVPRFNVLQAEVALANAKPPLISAQNNYRISQYQLIKLLGYNYTRTNVGQITFNVVGDLVYKKKVVSLDSSIILAIIRSPFLKAQRENILAQAANVSAALAGYLPSFNAISGYEFENNPTSSDLGSLVSGWFWGIQGSWNIIDGGLTYGKVKSAKAILMQAKNTYDDSLRQVVLNVQEAVSNLQNARETIDSQVASVTQAAEALRLSRERLDAGAGTQLDVLNAQVQLLQSQTTELQARYNYIAAYAQYEQALSLDTQYDDMFNDPMSKAEKRTFEKINDVNRKLNKLPRNMREGDPLDPDRMRDYSNPATDPLKKDKSAKAKAKAKANAKASPSPSSSPKPGAKLQGD